MCRMRLTLIAAKNRNIWVSQTPPVRSGVNQVIDITISDVEDNCLAAMGRNCSRLTPSYTAHLLFGEQHSPLLDEIISAFDSLEESVSDEGVAISVTVSEENKHLLTNYSSLDKLQTTVLAESIGMDAFKNVHHVVQNCDETQQQ